MRKFILKSLFFPLGLISSYTLFYFCSNAYLNSSFTNKNAIFIWGDSQAYQGIDLNKLSTTIEKKVYTSANHGAGVYDFLVFTEQVPENSEVIVSISKLVQVRRKKNDFNRSGLSIWALKKLYHNAYTTKEIISILKPNLKPRSNIRKSTELYAYSDSIQILNLSNFESYYQKIPSFFYEKQNIYLTGIQNLINKNCKISFLTFPYHAELVNIENKSPIKEKTDGLLFEIGNLFEKFEIDTIKLNKNKNVFRDLSHLNCRGAKDLSKKLGEKLVTREHTTIYVAE